MLRGELINDRLHVAIVISMLHYGTALVAILQVSVVGALRVPSLHHGVRLANDPLQIHWVRPHYLLILTRLLRGL